jgi:hypothetical protein
MKALIKTGITETLDKMPYLANHAVSFGGKIILDATTCLCRVAGTPAQIADILADASITEQTDDQARTIIQSKYPDSDLENIDIPDLEIDEIAKSLGLDPHLRADIQLPTRGKQVLQDQENYLLAMISTKKGKSKKFWDDEVGKSGKWAKGIDIENAIIDGKGAAHEFVLSRLR